MPTFALPLLATLGLNFIGGLLKKKTPLPNKLIPVVNGALAVGATMVVPDLTIEMAAGAVGLSTVLQQTVGYAVSKVPKLKLGGKVV